jgi:hypothetical protein
MADHEAILSRFGNNIAVSEMRKELRFKGLRIGKQTSLHGGPYSSIRIPLRLSSFRQQNKCTKEAETLHIQYRRSAAASVNHRYASGFLRTPRRRVMYRAYTNFSAERASLVFSVLHTSTTRKRRSAGGVHLPFYIPCIVSFVI